MDAVRYALDKVDEAERAVFSLKLFLSEERGRTCYKRRQTLTEALAAVSEAHEACKALVEKLMDISDAVSPLYEEGGDR